MATIAPGAAKIIQPPMNADKVSESQAQHDALDVQTRVAEIEQQADLQARYPKVVDALETDRAPPMIRSVRWSSMALSAFIGVHRRLKIPCFHRTNTLRRN